MNEIKYINNLTNLEWTEVPLDRGNLVAISNNENIFSILESKNIDYITSMYNPNRIYVRINNITSAMKWDERDKKINYILG